MAAMPEAPWHEFHAEAHVLSGHLQRPVEQKIERHAPVALKDRKGGHLTRFTEDVNIEGLVSFRRGSTRVSGSQSVKNDPKNHGWVTVATSILEGLNVFEVFTADRIVSQVATDHPLENGHYPHVTFLGSHFDNLRVNGVPLTMKLNLGICGERPKGDKSYLTDPGFLKCAKEQAERVVKTSGLPKDLQTEYSNRLAAINNLTKDIDKSRERKITCSIVKNIDNLDAIPIPGIQAVGHVLIIPHFGTVSLGEVEVSDVYYEGSAKPSNYFELMMVKIDMGCVGHGKVKGPSAGSNGQGFP
ncbi:MAG: hypothetical protein LAO56_10910 [Acidobacteriia bacterium]|nr:hypothetical protein [Terriglobia bacterium]